MSQKCRKEGKICITNFNILILENSTVSKPIIGAEASKTAEQEARGGRDESPYSIKVSIAILLPTLNNIVLKEWMNVIGYRQQDGTVQAITIWRAEGINLEKYEMYLMERLGRDKRITSSGVSTDKRGVKTNEMKKTEQVNGADQKEVIGINPGEQTTEQTDGGLNRDEERRSKKAKSIPARKEAEVKVRMGMGIVKNAR